MSVEQFQYPLDTTGTSPTNRITGEVQIISPPNERDFYFIIPKNGPYFRDSLKLVHQPSGRELKDGVDYHPSHHFRSASRATAKPVYGSITFLDKTLMGVVTLEYQTVGGEFTMSEQKMLQVLSEIQTNPRITTYEQIADLTVRFPPVDHEWDVDDLVGMSEVVDRLGFIATALIAKGEGSIDSHLLDFNNPHQTTKAHVGLGELFNYPVASKEEAEAGDRGDRYMTALRVKDAIRAIAGAMVDNHSLNRSNPHGVSKAQVGLGSVENLPLATHEDMIDGSRNDRYVTPVRVRQAIEELATGSVDVHVSDKANPHQVTKGQVGLGELENYPIANRVEAEVGLVGDRYMTPIRVKEAIVAQVLNPFNVHASDTTNPHRVTKSQVGLGLVQDYAVAEVADAEAGISNSLYMTPLRTRDAVEALALRPLNEHVRDEANPHNVTKAQVGLGNVDDYASADEGEARDGTLPDRFMSPLRVRQAIETIGGELLDSHASDITNPHSVTKAQVGLSKVQNFGVATSDEARDGTSNSTYMTPVRVREAFEHLAVEAGDHAFARDNPHGVTKAQVGLGNVEDYPVANLAEAVDPSNNSTYMTPMLVRDAVVAHTATLGDHLTDNDNPHSVTKAQVGLSAVQNYGVATATAAENGTANNLYMTPLRVKEAIEKFAVEPLDTHKNDRSNPHGVTKAQVGLGKVQDYPVANLAEAVDPSNNSTYMTPMLVRDAVVAHTVSSREHLTDTDNPHNVTKAQVGLGNVQDYPIANASEAVDPSNNSTYMTPMLVRDAVVAHTATLGDHLTDNDNPHGVTKAQVGLSEVQNYPMADVDDAVAGVSLEHYMSPKMTSTMISSIMGSGFVEQKYRQIQAESGVYYRIVSFSDALSKVKLMVVDKHTTEIDFITVSIDDMAVYRLGETEEGTEYYFHQAADVTEVWIHIPQFILDRQPSYVPNVILLSQYGGSVNFDIVTETLPDPAWEKWVIAAFWHTDTTYLEDYHNEIMSTVDGKIATEADRLDARIADTASTINGRVNTLQQSLTTQVATLRTETDQKVAVVNNRVTTEVATLNSKITTEVNKLNKAINNTATAIRSELAAAIDQVTLDLTAAIDAAIAELS